MSSSTFLKPQPLVKWAGGKRQLQDRIKLAFDQSGWDSENGTYFEPFFGGGAMFFHLQPRRGSFSDWNSSLIALYKEAKSETQRLIDSANLLQDEYNSESPDNKRAFFDNLKQEFNLIKGRHKPSDLTDAPSLPKVEDEPRLAVLFLFLNKAGFNGMYRENSAGIYNIPFGQRETIKLLDEANVWAVAEALREVEPKCVDYSTLVSAEQVQPNDLIYFDPPYAPVSEEKAAFTGYTKSGFGTSAQNELTVLAAKLASAEIGARVVISNAYNKGVISAYQQQGFLVYELNAKRFISASVQGRSPVKEILATSFQVEGLKFVDQI
jgi:DNA adenine methylase